MGSQAETAAEASRFLMELPPKSLVEQQPISRVAMILYGKGNSLAIIDSQGPTLSFQTYNDLTEQEREALKTHPFVDFSAYDRIAMIQTDIGDADIIVSPSVLRKRGTVGIKISYIKDNLEHQSVIDEKHLINLMTGQKAGLVVFQTGGGPEENALLFEEHVNKDTVNALLIFLHPKDSKFGIDSVNGVYAFFSSLNEQIKRKVGLPKNLEVALNIIDSYYERYHHEERKVRVEICKSVIIGHWLDGDTEGPFFKKYVSKILSLKHWLLKEHRARVTIPKIVDEAVNEIIVGRQAKENMQNVYHFRNTELYQLRLLFLSRFSKDTFGTLEPEAVILMDNYFQTLIGEMFKVFCYKDLFYTNTYLGYISDFEWMLDEIDKTSYGKERQIYYSDKIDTTNDPRTFFNQKQYFLPSENAYKPAVPHYFISRFKMFFLNELKAVTLSGNPY